MAKINDVEPNMLINKAAEELKKNNSIKAPEWAPFVKTGMQKERPPIKKDWWYYRLAAILRTVAIRGPVGVSKLRTKYGGKHRRGHQPAEFARGSGNIIRKALQQLEKAGYIKQAAAGVHKGRIITKEGTSFLNSIAENIKPGSRKPEAKKTARKHAAEKPAAPESKE